MRLGSKTDHGLVVIIVVIAPQLSSLFPGTGELFGLLAGGW